MISADDIKKGGGERTPDTNQPQFVIIIEVEKKNNNNWRTHISVLHLGSDSDTNLRAGGHWLWNHTAASVDELLQIFHQFQTMNGLYTISS